jgi:hypothetical protein
VILFLVTDDLTSALIGLMRVFQNGTARERSTAGRGLRHVRSQRALEQTRMPARRTSWIGIFVATGPDTDTPSGDARDGQRSRSRSRPEQCCPARHSHVNLTQIPVMILAAEASYHQLYDHCTAKYLNQAGVKTEYIKLQDKGLEGNGHMLMIEKNNLQVAKVVVD